MQSYRKMVNNKKAQILILVILLFALNGVYKINGLQVPNLVHLIKNSADGQEGLCIASGEETYSAVEWSYPIPEDEFHLPETGSSYLPAPSSSSNCNFEEHEECNTMWNLDKWFTPIHTPRNYVPIIDTRWEDLRTYLSTNSTKLTENSFEIPKNANIGISIRSGNTVDILLCKGYNPESYPCYTITLGGNTKKEVYVTKYGVKDKLSIYQSELPILSSDEWKHFKLSLSDAGQIRLKELNKGISYLNITDNSPLNILYLFVNSSLPSLWKIHKNHFLSTNVSQYIPFGQPINTTSSTICLSMFLMMCKSCSIYFYTINNNNKEIVLEVHPTNESNTSDEWTHIRLYVENVIDDAVQLFVKTQSDAIDKFWAIDNVRTCVKDEFKIRTLSKSNISENFKIDDPNFSCHSIKFPEWRPKKQLILSAELPMVANSPNSTSIQLFWKTAYQQPYFIKYKGSDICNTDTITQYKSKQRLKSNGWIVVKPKQTGVNIENLIPYTHYDVYVFDPVYGEVRNLSMNTNPTEKPTIEEIPSVIITPEVNQAKIVLPPRKCNVSYGPIVNRLDITQRSNSTILIDDIYYTWRNLEPYTNYTLSVETARTINNLKSGPLKVVNYYNFTTKPDVPPAIEAEVYESSQTSMSFRYRLPDKANGIPVLIRVAMCNPILRNNCSYNISSIQHCSLWEHLYCVTIENLMKKVSYHFKLSIKNNNTNTFGKEVTIAKDTIDAVPGVPINISYEVQNCSELSDYCNLNITWSHPYYQMGVISSFQIFLQDHEDVIMENILIENRQYLPVYWHVVKYVSYGRTYNMSIRASNNVYKSINASTVVKIDHIVDHIDQIPKILENNMEGVIFQIPKLDYRITSSTVIVIVQKNDSIHANILPNLISIANNDLCLKNRTSWIAGEWKLSHDAPTNVIIGNNSSLRSSIEINNTVINKPLSPNNEYCINFIIKDVYRNATHVQIYHEKYILLSQQPESSESSPPLSIWSILLIILLILLVTTVISFVVCRIQKGRRSRRRSYGEHIYEAMPADDYNDSCNVVYNAVYDKLNHD